MIKVEMKIKILLALVILFAIGVGALSVYLPTLQKEKELKKQLDSSNVKSETLKEQVEDLQENLSGQIMQKKADALADLKEGMVYFSPTVTRLSATTAQVDIYLKGDPKTTSDAIDLVITYPQSVHISEIRKGTAFVSYPRLLDQQGKITVTGVAMPQGNSFAYGKVNEIYATFIVEKQGTGAAFLELNQQDTQAYLNGTPILDFAQSFKKIDL